MGIELERFVEVNQDLICCICAGVLEEPVESPCRHVFCSECIKRWLRESKPTCPTCRTRIFVPQLKSALPMIHSMIARLQIRCDYADDGCKETVALDRLKFHLDACLFAPVSCAHEGCGMIVKRKDKQLHESGCPFKRVICTKGCGLSLLASDVGNHNCIRSLKCYVTEMGTMMADMETRMADMERRFTARIEQLSEEVYLLTGTSNRPQGQDAPGQTRQDTPADNDSGLSLNSLLSGSEGSVVYSYPIHTFQVSSESSDDSADLDQLLSRLPRTPASQSDRSRSRSPLRTETETRLSRRWEQASGTQRRQSSGSPSGSEFSRRRRERRQRLAGRTAQSNAGNSSRNDSSGITSLSINRDLSGSSSNLQGPTLTTDPEDDLDISWSSADSDFSPDILSPSSIDTLSSSSTQWTITPTLQTFLAALMSPVLEDELGDSSYHLASSIIDGE